LNESDIKLMDKYISSFSSPEMASSSHKFVPLSQQDPETSLES